MHTFSAINPAYPNACANETITGLPSTITPQQFNANKIAHRFQAHLNQTCAQRGFATQGFHMNSLTFHPTSTTTVNWDGQVWTK